MLELLEKHPFITSLWLAIGGYIAYHGRHLLDALGNQLYTYLWPLAFQSTTIPYESANFLPLCNIILRQYPNHPSLKTSLATASTSPSTSTNNNIVGNASDFVLGKGGISFWIRCGTWYKWMHVNFDRKTMLSALTWCHLTTKASDIATMLEKELQRNDGNFQPYEFFLEPDYNGEFRCPVPLLARKEVFHNTPQYKELQAFVKQCLHPGPPLIILISGPHGTGKTSMARQLVYDFNMDFIFTTMHPFRRPLTLIDRRFLMLVDEVDRVDEYSQVSNTTNLQTIFDTLNTNPMVIVMTTNYPEKLTPGLLRRVALHIRTGPIEQMEQLDALLTTVCKSPQQKELATQFLAPHLPLLQHSVFRYVHFMTHAEANNTKEEAMAVFSEQFKRTFLEDRERLETWQKRPLEVDSPVKKLSHPPALEFSQTL